jgi:hypothetical protein
MLYNDPNQAPEAIHMRTRETALLAAETSTVPVLLVSGSDGSVWLLSADEDGFFRGHAKLGTLRAQAREAKRLMDESDGGEETKPGMLRVPRKKKSRKSGRKDKAKTRETVTENEDGGVRPDNGAIRRRRWARRWSGVFDKDDEKKREELADALPSSEVPPSAPSPPSVIGEERVTEQVLDESVIVDWMWRSFAPKKHQACFLPIREEEEPAELVSAPNFPSLSLAAPTASPIAPPPPPSPPAANRPRRVLLAPKKRRPFEDTVSKLKIPAPRQPVFEVRGETGTVSTAAEAPCDIASRIARLRSVIKSRSTAPLAKVVGRGALFTATHLT